METAMLDGTRVRALDRGGLGEHMPERAAPAVAARFQRSWMLQLQKAPPEEKITVRRAMKGWSAAEDTYVDRDGQLTNAYAGEPANAICLLWKDNGKTEDITDFYEAITPHMKEPLYWINYASYATGDLTSLAAAAITDPRHGISMYWLEIGPTDPDKNMEVLRSFLGGRMDMEKDSRYVITRLGAKGRWAKGPITEKVNRGNLTKNSPDEMKEAALAKTLFDAACQYLSAGKFLYCLSLDPQFEPKDSFLLIKLPLVAHALSAVRELGSASATAEERTDLTQLWTDAVKEVADCMQWTICFAEDWWKLRKLSVQFPKPPKMDVNGKIKQAIASRAWQSVADTILRCALWVGGTTSFIYRTHLDQRDEDGHISPPQVTDNSKGIVNPPKFTEGTNLIAMSWNAEKREQLREAWGVGRDSARGAKADYDKAVKEWLAEQGIPPAQAVYGKDVVVLWIRRSGERGGAHFENDTSFGELKESALQYARQGNCSVFLAGDSDKERVKKIREQAQNIYDITEFWQNPSDKQKAWNINGRVGQFRLYDYLNRRAGSLKHVGPMSGNMEAMALLGHTVEVQAQSPQAPGVSRMLAYAVHDQASDDADKLSYNFTFRSDPSSGLRPYGKRAARYYMQLHPHAKRIFQQIESGRFFQPKGPEPPFFKQWKQEYARIQQRKAERELLCREERELDQRLQRGDISKQDRNKRLKEIALQKQQYSGLREQEDLLSVRLKAREGISPFQILDNVPVWQKSSAKTKHLKAAWVRGLAQGRSLHQALEDMGSGPDVPERQEWGHLSEAHSQLYDDYARMEQEIEKTACMVVWKYSELRDLPPASGHALGKQKEQLFNRILIQASKILAKQEKKEEKT